MNKEYIDMIEDHITNLRFGDVLTKIEDDEYIYTIHYEGLYYSYRESKDIWFNIFSKKYKKIYSYHLKSFPSKYNLLHANSCICNNRIHNCKKCMDKITGYIKHSDKIKLILMLE